MVLALLHLLAGAMMEYPKAGGLEQGTRTFCQSAGPRSNQGFRQGWCLQAVRGVLVRAPGFWGMLAILSVTIFFQHLHVILLSSAHHGF